MRFTSLPGGSRCRGVACLALSASFCLGVAQSPESLLQPWLESIAEKSGEEAPALSILADQLSRWLLDPINLNEPTADELVAWQLLTPAQYVALQVHLARHGPLLTVLELQAVEGFTPELIRALIPFVTVGQNATEKSPVPFGRRFIEGHDELYLRTGRTLQTAEGYGGSNRAYGGSPDKLYVRYRHRNSDRLSYGFTWEKDPGEKLLSVRRPAVPDFVSGHLAMRPGSLAIESLVLGDYTISFGQGLISHAGYRTGNVGSALRRSGQTLRPYSAVEENSFFRGVGLTLRPLPQLEITGFASHRRRDANLSAAANADTTFTQITSLQTSGLHRTATELADKDAAGIAQYGMRISTHHARRSAGLNVLHSKLELPLHRTPALYNRYDFSGRSLTQASLDYHFFVGGVHFFGESAISENGGTAHAHGLLASPDRHIQVSILFRSYDRHYHSLGANAPGESTFPANERGLLTGVQLLPAPRWRIELYHDLWKHPWLTASADAPAEGREAFLRFGYLLRRTLDVYGQFRFRETQVNTRNDGELIARLLPQQTTQWRIQVNTSLGRDVRFRTRIAWTRSHLAKVVSKGLLIAQDVLIDPVGSPWSGTARVALFDIADYDARIYAYENDLIGTYTLPAYSGTGTRYFILLRYKGFRGITLECKLAETVYRNQASVGSGHDRIEGNRKTEFNLQFIYRT